MLFPPLGSTAGYKVQGVAGSRGSQSSAFSVPGPASCNFEHFPSLPQLPGHVLYFVTPAYNDGDSFRDAINDLLSFSTWFTTVHATSPNGTPHFHYIVAFPEHHESWLAHHPTIFRSGRHIPCVKYSRTNKSMACSLSFSKITNPAGLRGYLEGPRNRAKFVTILNPSPRAVWRPNRENSLEIHPRSTLGSFKASSIQQFQSAPFHTSHKFKGNTKQQLCMPPNPSIKTSCHRPDSRRTPTVALYCTGFL